MEERFPYQLVSHWRVPGRIEDVFAVLTDGENLPRLWSEAYHRVREIQPGEATGKGRVVEIVTRGQLPYELTWRMEVLEETPPTSLKIRASGELVGVGAWQLRQNGPDVELTYDWRVRAEKPWMRALEGVLKPLFAWNHHWVMARGEAGMKRELARRAASGGG